MFLKLLSITNDFLNHKISEKTLEKELEKYPLEKAPFLDRQTTYIVKKEAKK